MSKLNTVKAFMMFFFRKSMMLVSRDRNFLFFF